MHTDDVDMLLTMSDPAGELADRERQVAAAMVDQSIAAKRRRRHARPIAAGASGALLLAGGGMAATAATGLWDRWAHDDPLAVLHYELPSGTPCEMRIGNVQGAPDEVHDLIRETLAGVNFDDADIAHGAALGGASGDVSSDDRAYQTGYNWSVVHHVEEALAAHDLDGEVSQFNAQAVCE